MKMIKNLNDIFVETFHEKKRYKNKKNFIKNIHMAYEKQKLNKFYTYKFYHKFMKRYLQK